MKRMLINATQPEELRVALVDGQWLYDLDIENRTREQKKANIYKGKITRVEPSLEAAFVDYGAERHGFLPLKEISRQYFIKSPGEIDGRVKIKDVVKEGQEVVVQIDKEERGNKGAALTTLISLAGRYLVLMPNNPRAGGISRRIDGEDRAELRDALAKIEIPKGMGVIVRTAGVGRSAEELQWDLDNLLKLWASIEDAANTHSAPNFLFQESNVLYRAIRDYLRLDIGEILVDRKESYDLVKALIQQMMPGSTNKVKLYQDDTPLFNRYQIESQIETAFQREVKLPSGGSIVIDVTEALVSIDINSSRATKGADIEETALRTNLEAADEIARQLRLRDMGGLVVIDFIDMQPVKNQREVENRMKDALSMDRARVQVGRISRFGLLEMSRQRLRPSLEETSSKVCPRCVGQGTIRGTKSIALSILRLVEEEAQKERSAEIRAITPVSVATYLLNEKRVSISGIESRNKTRVVIVPNEHMVTPHFEVQRLRDDETSEAETSYKIVSAVEEAELEEDVTTPPLKAAPQPVVQQLRPTDLAPAPEAPVKEETPAPETAAKQQAPAQTGFWSKLMRALVGPEPTPVEKEEKPKAEKTETEEEKPRSNNQRNRNRGRRNNRRNDNRSDNRNTERNSDSRANDGNDQQGNSEADSGRSEQNGERSNRRNNRRRRPKNQRNDQSNDSTQDQQQNTQGDSSNGESDNSPAKRPSNKRARPQPRRRGRRDNDENNAADSTTESAEVAELNTQVNEAIDAQQTESEKPARRPSRNRRRSQRDGQTNTSEKSAVATEEPSAVNKEPSAVNKEPSAVASEEPKQVEKPQAATTEKQPEAKTDAPAASKQDVVATEAAKAASDVVETGDVVENRAEPEAKPEVTAKAPSEANSSEQNSVDTAPQSSAEAETVKESQTKDAKPLVQAELDLSESNKPEAELQSSAPAANADAVSTIEKAVNKVETATQTDAEAQPSDAIEASAEKPAPTQQQVVAETTASEPKAYTRAANDPRVNPRTEINADIRTVEVTVSMSAPLDTAVPAAIAHNPRPLPRPANDPRLKRSTTDAVSESSEGA